MTGAKARGFLNTNPGGTGGTPALPFEPGAGFVESGQARLAKGDRAFVMHSERQRSGRRELASGGR